MQRNWVYVLAAALSGAAAWAADAPRRETTSVNVEEMTAEAANTPAEPLVPFDRTIYRWLQKTKKEMRERHSLE